MTDIRGHRAEIPSKPKAGIYKYILVYQYTGIYQLEYTSILFTAGCPTRRKKRLDTLGSKTQMTPRASCTISGIQVRSIPYQVYWYVQHHIRYTGSSNTIYQVPVYWYELVLFTTCLPTARKKNAGTLGTRTRMHPIGALNGILVHTIPRSSKNTLMCLLPCTRRSFTYTSDRSYPHLMI